MVGVLRRLANNLLESCKDLLPIVLVVAFFQIIVLKQAIPEIGVILLGTLSILLGLTFFVSGLRLGLFPIGENLAHSFVNKGSLFWLLLFSFALGFGSSIAEPALMAVSQEAAIVASIGGIIENNELAINKYSLELRYPISLGEQAKIFALTFIEGGSSYNSFRDFDTFLLKRSAGIGVRLFMPQFGLLGIDFGHGFDPIPGQSTKHGWDTHFIFGQNF